jgi:hypothetical protein
MSQSERDLGQLIRQRDEAEEAMAQAYFLVTGRSPDRSINFDHKQALEEIAAAVKLLKGHVRDAERWRTLRQETDLSSDPGSGISKVVLIRLDASGCAKFLESGAPDIPATLDAILDAELAERGGVT